MAISKRFIELLEQAKDLHIRKNEAYAGSDAVDPFRNFKNSNLFGISPFLGCMVRISDKFMRIASLCRNPDADKVGESITDTLMDMSVYCLIAICLYEEEHEKKGNNNG